MFRGDIVPLGLTPLGAHTVTETFYMFKGIKDRERDEFLRALLGPMQWMEFKRRTGTDWPIIGGDAPD